MRINVRFTIHADLGGRYVEKTLSGSVGGRKEDKSELEICRELFSKGFLVYDGDSTIFIPSTSVHYITLLEIS